jgi:hypothetical protein
MDTRAHLEFTSLKVNEGSTRCGIHHDPPAPLPALIAGATGWRLVTPPSEPAQQDPPAQDIAISPPASPSKQTPSFPTAARAHWVPKHKGGRLFLFDGLWDLSWGPQDLVILDGRFTHGVTALRDLPGTNQTGPRAELTRYSVILFSAWKRAKMKGEKRLREGHLSQWQEEWMDAVPWLCYGRSAPTDDMFAPTMLSGARARKPVQRYMQDA